MRSPFRKDNNYLRKMMIANDVSQEELAKALYMSKNSLVWRLKKELSEEETEKYIQKIFEISRRKNNKCYRMVEVKE